MRLIITVLLVFSLVFLAPASTFAKESMADLFSAVADSEFIVTCTVKNSGADGSVTLAVDTWIKGAATPSGELVLKGETGFCIERGPISQFMTAGKRYLIFVFPGGKPGRLGHIHEINADGTLKPNSMMHFDKAAPSSEKEFVESIKYVLEKAPAQFEKDISSQDAKVRSAAICGLGTLRVKSAYASLLAIALNTKNDDPKINGGYGIRDEAIRAIGRLKNPEAVPSLLKLLDEKNDEHWKFTVVYVLGELGDERAIPAIVAVATSALAQEPLHDDTLRSCADALIAIGLFNPEVDRVLSEILRRGEGSANEIIYAASHYKRTALTRIFAEALEHTQDKKLIARAGSGLFFLSRLSEEESGIHTPTSTEELGQADAIVLSGKALEAKNIDAAGRTIKALKADGRGWLIEYLPPKNARAGIFYVFVENGAQKETVLLIDR